MFELHRLGSTIAHSDFRNERALQHGEVLMAENRTEISTRGATSQTAPLRGLIETNSLLRNTVEIFVGWNACRDTRVDEQSIERMTNAQVRDAERASIGVILSGAVLVVLGAQEIRQHLRETPACCAPPHPTIVVIGIAAHVPHAIDRAAAAEHLARRPGVDAPIARRV